MHSRAAGVVDPRRHLCSHRQDQGVEHGRHQTSRVQRFGQNCSNGELPGSQALVWIGSGIPSHQQDVKTWGPSWVTPISLPPICNEFQRNTRPFYSASRLFLTFNPFGCCFSNALRPERHLRVVGLSAVEEFARHHDESLWQCLSHILQVDVHRQFEKSPHFLFGRSWFA